MLKFITIFFLFFHSMILFADEEFTDVKVRVIRPRYFNKKFRFELGLGSMVVTNQTFIYTYHATASLGLHLSEHLGIEGLATMGGSVDKMDKALLERDFDISTQILRTKEMFMGWLLWTPIYGKFQIASGKVVYFDTFASVGGGMTGVEYNYDYCVKGGGLVVPDPMVALYPTGGFGIGQRFFLGKNSSFRWDIRGNIFIYDTADGSCVEGAESANSSQQNTTIQLGYSVFI